MPMTPRLLTIATAVPPHRIEQRDIAAFCETLFAGAFTNFGRLRGAYENAAIETRYACAPLEWYAEPHGPAERNRLYIENALALMERAAVKALAAAGLDAGAIDAIITVSSTGIATPSLDALLMERLGMRRNTRRLLARGGVEVGAGHYRFPRHPNYAVVAAEVAVLPLAFGAWEIAAPFSLLNLALPRHRIHIEDAALAARRGPARA